jgi:hypothetical protein
VVNERDLLVFNCSKHHSPKADHPEVFLMDLLQLNIWKKVKIRSDMRPDEFVNFGLVPIKRSGESRYNVLMLGGPTNTMRSTYLLDDRAFDISKCSITVPDMDRICCNQLYLGKEGLAYCFGASRIHIFNQST